MELKQGEQRTNQPLVLCLRVLNQQTVTAKISEYPCQSLILRLSLLAFNDPNEVGKDYKRKKKPNPIKKERLCLLLCMLQYIEGNNKH